MLSLGGGRGGLDGSQLSSLAPGPGSEEGEGGEG